MERHKEEQEELEGVGRIFYKEDMMSLFRIKEGTFHRWLGEDLNGFKTYSRKMSKRPFWTEADVAKIIEGLR